MNIPLPRDGDEQDKFPLGKPVPRKAPDAPEWLPHGNTPGVERHRVTGKLRHIPRPPPDPLVTPWWPLVPIAPGEDPWDNFLPEQTC
jgi:hypothetical protein